VSTGDPLTRVVNCSVALKTLSLSICCFLLTCGTFCTASCIIVELDKFFFRNTLLKTYVQFGCVVRVLSELILLFSFSNKFSSRFNGYFNRWLLCIFVVFVCCEVSLAVYSDVIVVFHAFLFVQRSSFGILLIIKEFHIDVTVKILKYKLNLLEKKNVCENDKRWKRDNSIEKLSLFLPRDAMLARYMLSCVRPSVCLEFLSHILISNLLSTNIFMTSGSKLGTHKHKINSTKFIQLY